VTINMLLRLDVLIYDSCGELFSHLATQLFLKALNFEIMI